MATVEESYAHCRRIARRRGRNFYYSFLLLPRERRQAMCAVYAFMRYCDDISDEPEPPLHVRRSLLQRWRTALEKALQGHYGDDPILPGFHQTVLNYRIPPEYFFELIEGVGSDLRAPRYNTFEDLYRYCYRVASVVGMTSIHIFGYDSQEALRLAEKCGVAFQLTNILRDIPEDARVGRIYLPIEELTHFGLTPSDLIEERLGPQFEALMEFQWTRAQRFYEQASPLLGMVRPESRAALWAMISTYHGILQRIRGLGYNVYAKRATLSHLEKTWIVVQASKLRFMSRPPQLGGLTT